MGLIWIAISVAFYLFESYTVAFWIVTFGLANSIFGTARALVDPNWYFAQRNAASIDHGQRYEVNLIRPPYILSMLTVKAFTVVPSLVFLWHLATLLGYIS